MYEERPKRDNGRFSGLTTRPRKDVQQKQHDLEDTKRDAAARIAQKERRVQDAAREGNEKVIQEERQLEDAVRADVRRNETNDTTVTPAPAERPTRVDVNINREPGSGVKVDVHKNP